MSVPSPEGVEGGGTPANAVDGPVDVLSSFVFQTDDVVAPGALWANEDHPPARFRKHEQAKSPEASIVTAQSSGATWPNSSDQPRPSVAKVVTTEVATFFDVFGLLGIPMILVFLLSALWTFALAAIQVNPNEMANSIMNTTEFDNGNFWLLPQPEAPLIISSVVMLSLFGIGYTGLVAAMLFCFRSGHHNEAAHEHADADAANSGNNPESDAVERAKEAIATERSSFQQCIVWIRHKCQLPADIRQHYYTAVLDLPKLIFQTTTLYTYLERGFPTPIIYFYSVLLLCNWLVACYRSQRYVADPALIIARLYYTFDLFFAVFAPLVVLVFFIYSFKFDRASFLTKTETLTARTFDTVARLFGDPSEISSFCSAFHYLQFSSGTTLFYKSALNLLSLYKWRKIIFTLIHNHHERQLERKRKALVEPARSSSSRDGSFKAALAKSFTVTRPKIGKHFAPKLFLSLFFFAAGVGNVVYSIGAVHSTADLCSKYTKCVVTSYHWNFGETYCTCLVFADRQTAPQTYAEWTDPEDTTDNLAELAMAGHLRIVQIINRALPELPEALRNSHELEQLILVYTKTENLPDWLSEFSHLEYIHIEGDFTSKRLTIIPDGVFDNMPHLSFLHLGGMPNVEKLPSLSSLKGLRYLALAVLDSLKEIPSFGGLAALTDISIVNAARATTLPSLAPLVSLKALIIRAKSAVCCNGFISGTCTLTADQCLPTTSEKYPVVCTSSRISDADKAMLDSFGSRICPNGAVVDREVTSPSKYTTDDLCGGIKFKKCSLSGKEGMCFNTRLMVINCETTAGFIAMRKLQIERGVGEPCDPEIEEWLGCKA